MYSNLSLYPVKLPSLLFIRGFALPRWIIILFFLMPSLTDLFHNHFRLSKDEVQIHGSIWYFGVDLRQNACFFISNQDM